MSKLTTKDIEKIEDLINDVESVGHRATIIKHGIRDIAALSGFISVMRHIGVSIQRRQAWNGLSPEDALAFQEFLKQKKKS